MNMEGEEKQEEASSAMMMMIDEKQEASSAPAPVILLRCVIDNHRFKVAEVVALQIPIIRARLKLLKMKIKGNPKKIKMDVSGGVTHGSLELVIKYLCNIIHPSLHPFDFHAEFRQLEPYSILNLIQAAHSLRLKNLMDLTCQRLANKVITDVPTTYTYDMSLTAPQHSHKDCSPDEKAILRTRAVENFENSSYFLDVHLTPILSVGLRHVSKWVTRLESTFSKHFFEVWKCADLEELRNGSFNSMQLTIAIRRLEEIIVGDPRFSSCLREHVVLYLIKLLKSGACNLDIKCAAFSILSRGKFNCCDKMEKEVVPLLGKFVSESTESTRRLFHAAVSALTRLAYIYPELIKVIVDDNVFQAVCNAFCNPNLDKHCLAKFLAAVCRGYRLSSEGCRGYRASSEGLSSDKVETVINILEDYLFTLTNNEDIHVCACYTLLHLSYGRIVSLETKTWNKLIKRLIVLIHIPNFEPRHCSSVKYGSKKVMIIGSALGVIGNFIKWGSVQQIESLITEPDLHLLEFIRRVLSSESRKLQIEGSRIISNLAARRTILDEIVLSGVVDCLCKLLENETFEVKWEAAWAVINGIYGCGKHRKVEQCLEMEQAK